MTNRLRAVASTLRFAADLFAESAIDGLYHWWHRDEPDPLITARALIDMLRDELDEVALDRDLAVAALYEAEYPVGGRLGAVVWDVSSN